MTVMYDNVHICTYSMQLEAPGGYLCPRWYIIGFLMEEGEVRVGALGGEGGAVWAVRLASSLVFVLLLLLCCAARCAWS